MLVIVVLRIGRTYQAADTIERLGDAVVRHHLHLVGLAAHAIAAVAVTLRFVRATVRTAAACAPPARAAGHQRTVRCGGAAPKWVAMSAVSAGLALAPPWPAAALAVLLLLRRRRLELRQSQRLELLELLERLGLVPLGGGSGGLPPEVVES